MAGSETLKKDLEGQKGFWRWVGREDQDQEEGGNEGTPGMGWFPWSPLLLLPSPFPKLSPAQTPPGGHSPRALMQELGGFPRRIQRPRQEQPQG